MATKELNKNIVSRYYLRTVIPVLGCLLISAVLYMIGILYLLGEEKKGVLSTTKTILENTLQTIINDAAEIHNASIEVIKSNNQIQNAWLEKDREALLDLANPIFNALRNNHDITHFYFHGVDRVNFLRIHEPLHYGDLIERTTFKQSFETKSPYYGIEFGGFTQLFVLRVVHPWYINDELSGFIELGKEVKNLIFKVAEISNIDLSVLIHKDYFSQLDQIYQKKYDWVIKNLDNEWMIIYSSNSWVEKLLEKGQLNLELIQNKNGIEHRFNNKHLHTSAIELLDADYKHAGQVIYTIDITETENKKTLILISSFLILLFLTSGLFYIYARYSKKIQYHLNIVYENLEDEIHTRKEAEAELEVYSRQLEKTVEEKTKDLVQTNKELRNDIELRKKLENDFNASERKYRTLFEKTPDAILIIDNNTFVDCNDATVKMLQYSSKEELLMTHPSELSPPTQPDGRESWEKAEELMSIAFKNGSHRFEWEHKRSNGEVFPVEVLLTSIPVGDKHILYTVWHDISDRKRNEKIIEHQAYYDSLTDLPNRSLFIDRLQQAISHAIRYKHNLAVLFFDLDHFKNINDTLGHSIGDLLIIEIANRIKSSIREGDTAARFGGDEFVILLSELPNNDSSFTHAEKVAEKIRKTISTPFNIEQYDLNTTASIGISIFTGKNDSYEDLLRQADMAMYRAKNDGRNTIRFFLPSMQAEVTRRLSLEKDLVDAFEKRELYTCYQPQYYEDKNIYGVEVLLRWQHKTHGHIPPTEFISIAEDIGLIIPISEWVLEKAFSDIKKINEFNDYPVRLSINLSPLQFKDPLFISSITSSILDNKYPPDLLTFEITENVIIENITDAINKCISLKDIGVKISLDDFGTGYSSLSYLKELPIDEIKIDKSFIRDIEIDKNDEILVQTIISMASLFNLKLVAEGVETEQQFNYLRNLKCDIYQGFYMCKPLKIEELIDLFQSSSDINKSA